MSAVTVFGSASVAKVQGIFVLGILLSPSFDMHQ